MTTIDCYQEVLQRHAIAPATFAALVQAFFRDVPDNIGPCIKNTASLSAVISGLEGREQVGIYISDQDTNTDLLFDAGPGTQVRYYPAILFRALCILFKESVFRFYKAKKITGGPGSHTTVVFAAYHEGLPVYFGDLREISS